MRDCLRWNTNSSKQLKKSQDVLWIKWMHNVYIKDTNQWDYEAARTDSWSWKMLCKVKNQLKPAYSESQWLDDTKNNLIKEGYGWLVCKQKTSRSRLHKKLSQFISLFLQLSINLLLTLIQTSALIYLIIISGFNTVPCHKERLFLAFHKQQTVAAKIA